MAGRLISRCTRALDFHPLRPWPRVLCAFSWRGHLICGFDRADDDGEAFDLSEQDLVASLKAVHPELTFGELARLERALGRAGLIDAVAGQALFNAYDLRLNDRLRLALDVYLETPPAFQAWTERKSWAARDYAPLLALQPAQLGALAPLLESLTDTSLSKSDGVRVVEFATELFLMETPPSELFPGDETPAMYLRRLENLRRPQTLARDERRQRQVAEWPWPAQVEGRWQRFGDESGVEIKLRASSPQDLRKKLDRLEGIELTWSRQI